MFSNSMVSLNTLLIQEYRKTRAYKLLHQTLSLAIQRENTTSIVGALNFISMDEIRNKILL